MKWETVTGILGGLTAVLVPALAFLRGKRQDDISEVAQLLTRVKNLEAKSRIVDDYIVQLRLGMQRAGLEVPPWPEALKEMD